MGVPSCSSNQVVDEMVPTEQVCVGADTEEQEMITSSETDVLTQSKKKKKKRKHNESISDESNNLSVVNVDTPTITPETNASAEEDQTVNTEENSETNICDDSVVQESTIVEIGNRSNENAV